MIEATILVDREWDDASAEIIPWRMRTSGWAVSYPDAVLATRALVKSVDFLCRHWAECDAASVDRLLRSVGATARDLEKLLVGESGDAITDVALAARVAAL